MQCTGEIRVGEARLHPRVRYGLCWEDRGQTDQSVPTIRRSKRHRAMGGAMASLRP